LDVRMKEGNSKKPEVTGGIGTVFSRLAVEAPIVKDKASFIVAARRSYLDVLARPFTDIFSDGAALNFYDLTAKTNWNINPRNRVYLSGYFGRDRFLFAKNQGFSWGNSTSSFRWNHLFNDRLFANVTTLFSRYDYRLQFGDDDVNLFKWNSSISNFIFKPEFTWFVNARNEVTFGGEAIYYSFAPANAVGITNGDAVDISLPRKYNGEFSIFAGNSQKVSPAVALEYGLRLSQFRLFGPGESYVFNDTIPGKRPTLKDLSVFGKGETISSYTNLQPRFSFKWQVAPNASVKGSYNRMVQYLHLISNTTASNPLDVWTPSTKNIKPELADQFTLGWFADLDERRSWEFSVEGYYRRTQNQVDYIDGADLLINKLLEGDLLVGRGRAYGVEFYLQKKTGRFNGWMGYTLGKTELQVNGINRGNWYPTRFDQRHNLKLSGFYDLGNRWSFSANFVLTTGTPVTFPTSRLVVQNILIPYNVKDSRNNVRLPAYHRLDLSFRLDGKKMKRGKERKNTDYWVFGVYNVYGRKNPFSVYFSQKDERTPVGLVQDAQATQLAIVGTLIPSISYNFRF
ncbi:MAG: TonB-dependent receptor plug domain-containing protein, partial [Bacteroidota bacterium]